MEDKASIVEDKVRELYENKSTARATWADWLWSGHVLCVADKAAEIAEQKGVDASLSRIAALLHDVADAVMQREDDGHEARSLEIARQILTDAGYEEETISVLVDDALAKHSCQDGNIPVSSVGKVLATADGLAHLQSGFFAYAIWSFGNENRSYDKLREWAAAKVERDFNIKLLFDDVKEQARPQYETLKMIFSA